MLCHLTFMKCKKVFYLWLYFQECSSMPTQQKITSNALSDLKTWRTFGIIFNSSEHQHRTGRVPRLDWNGDVPWQGLTAQQHGMRRKFAREQVRLDREHNSEGPSRPKSQWCRSANSPAGILLARTKVNLPDQLHIALRVYAERDSLYSSDKRGCKGHASTRFAGTCRRTLNIAHCYRSSIVT
jgi:hypothetical protein